MLSRSAARNTPEAYEVFYSIEYAIDLDGREILPMQTAQLSKSYSYDSNIALGKQREQLGLQQALASELAGVVLRRLASLKPEQAP